MCPQKCKFSFFLKCFSIRPRSYTNDKRIHWLHLSMGEMSLLRGKRTSSGPHYIITFLEVVTECLTILVNEEGLNSITASRPGDKNMRQQLVTWSHLIVSLEAKE